MATTQNTPNIEPNSESAEIKQGTTKIIASNQAGFDSDNKGLDNKLTNVPIEQSSINDFFRKKIEVSSVNWSSLVGPLTVLDTIYIDAQLNSNPLWSNKLSGYLNFSATAVLTVQINATPFQQGALYLAWKPYVDNDPDYGVYDRMHATHLINLSQLPGHLMTISSDTIEIRIPYVGPVQYYRRDSANKWVWGALAICVYSPLRSGATDNVLVKTWLSFDDVRVEMPYFAQMNVSRISRGTVSEEEDSQPVSGTIRTLKRIVDSQKSIAYEMSALCSPPKWLLESLEDNAKAMGWSKPNNSDSLTRMVRNLYFFGPNSDGQDISQPMSVRADNKIKLMPNFGVFEGDEMSIDYIKSKWSYYATFSFTTSNVTGDGLYNMEHRPTAYTQTTDIPTGPATTKAIFNMAPLCWIGQYFQNWRGDVEVKFVLVKTGFHSGSMSITYVPGSDTNTFTYSSAPYNLRTVLDIQEAEEFCFRVPYAVPDPYLGFLTKAGQIHVHCVTPLKAPSTVNSSIDILVYVRGAPNLQFQALRNEGPRAVYYAQGANIENEGCVEENVIGNGSPSNDQIDFNALCIGESIQSLKQIALRMEKFGLVSSTTGITQFKVKTNSTNVFGWEKTGIPAYYSFISRPRMTPTFLDTLMCCFLFQRGSTRIGVYCQNNFYMSTLKMPIDWAQNSYDLRTDRWLFSTNSLNTTMPSLFASEHSTGGIIVKAPFYSRFPMTMIRPTWTNTMSPTGRWDTDHYINIEAQNTWNIADNSTNFSRSVGDDFQLGFFIGIPTVCFY